MKHLLTPSYIAIIAFVITATVVASQYGNGKLIVTGYIVMSIVSYILYSTDKRSARKGNSRVPENTLHIVSLFCGWPGALLAQQLLRHKSQKQSFIRMLWVTIIINVVIFLWFFMFR